MILAPPSAFIFKHRAFSPPPYDRPASGGQETSNTFGLGGTVWELWPPKLSNFVHAKPTLAPPGDQKYIAMQFISCRMTGTNALKLCTKYELCSLIRASVAGSQSCVFATFTLSHSDSVTGSLV